MRREGGEEGGPLLSNDAPSREGGGSGGGIAIITKHCPPSSPHDQENLLVARRDHLYQNTIPVIK